MADEQPSLHIDTDWKKQAQEEKRKLAEQEQKRAAEKEAAKVSASTMNADIGPGAATGAVSTNAPARGRAGSPGAPRERVMPAATFATLVSSLVTQVLMYLGDLAPRGTEPQVNLDMAKFNVDLLGVIEDKTKNNLSPEEHKMLDNALYEVRMRFVSVAQQYATV